MFEGNFMLYLKELDDPKLKSFEIHPVSLKFYSSFDKYRGYNSICCAAVRVALYRLYKNIQPFIWLINSNKWVICHILCYTVMCFHNYKISKSLISSTVMEIIKIQTLYCFLTVLNYINQEWKLTKVYFRMASIGSLWSLYKNRYYDCVLVIW